MGSHHLGGEMFSRLPKKLITYIKKFIRIVTIPSSVPKPVSLTQPQLNQNATLILTTNQSIRGAQNLEFTIRTIFNASEYDFLIADLVKHLVETGNDDNYSQIYVACRDYLIKATEIEPIEPEKKSVLINALNRVHQHFILTVESLNAYKPNTKPNPQAIFYPNPEYGGSLYDELPFAKKNPIINKKSKIGAAGDSVATTISTFLKQQKYYFIANEQIDKSLNINKGISAAIFCRYLELAFNQQNLLAFFKKINVFFLSLSSSEVYSQSADGRIASSLTLSVEENIQELQKILNLWQAINPTLKLIIAVSPIPDDNLCVTSHVKAILRVSVEEFVRRNPDSAFYFPAFDTIMYSVKNLFKDDIQNISVESAEKLARLFEVMYLEVV